MLVLATDGGKRVPKTVAIDVDCMGCRTIVTGAWEFEPAPPLPPGDSYDRPQKAKRFKCPHCSCEIGVIGPFVLEVDWED